MSNQRYMQRGVSASNSMLRQLTQPLDPVFAKPEFSTDNAMGIAVLTYLNQEA